jgi:hypothetical protein
MLLAGLGNMLPAMTISDIPAMVHQPQIASIVVQAVAIDMITLLFSSISMERLRLHRCGWESVSP